MNAAPDAAHADFGGGRGERRKVADDTRHRVARHIEGELVATEAELAKAEGRTYETAEQLLARIRATQAVQNDRSRPRTRKVAAK